MDQQIRDEPDPAGLNVTRRFAPRATYYHHSRPSYPPTILPYLEQKIDLTPDLAIADIGSGTGLLTSLFLDYGCRVFGVEPNQEMRGVAETMLAGESRFTSIPGRAEATNLPAGSVDLVLAGQAFHWFDWPRAKAEFLRILRPGGWAIMIWNRQDRTSALVRAYQEVLHQFGQSYQEIDHTRPSVPEALGRFYAPAGYQEVTFPNEQRFDWEGFRGRFLSTSTAPLPGEEDYIPAIAALQAAFTAHQQNGWVRFPYVTQVYTGRLSSSTDNAT